MCLYLTTIIIIYKITIISGDRMRPKANGGSKKQRIKAIISQGYDKDEQML